MVWPFVQDGIPILYQGQRPWARRDCCFHSAGGADERSNFLGQEQSYTGGNDPHNREA